MTDRSPRLQAALYALLCAGLYNKVIPGQKALANAAVAATSYHSNVPGSDERLSECWEALFALEQRISSLVEEHTIPGAAEGLIHGLLSCIAAAQGACMEDDEEALRHAKRNGEEAKRIFELSLRTDFSLTVAEAFIDAWIVTYGPPPSTS